MTFQPPVEIRAHFDYLLSSLGVNSELRVRFRDAAGLVSHARFISHLVANSIAWSRFNFSPAANSC